MYQYTSIINYANCFQAYIHKKRFVATVYAGYQDCVRAVNKIYIISHLPSPAWHLCTQKDDTILQDKLVADICYLKKTMDTKETNFFFSALLTGFKCYLVLELLRTFSGVLSHHLGWVETVMPSSGIGDNFLNKPGAMGMDEFTKENWYSPTRIQFRELHGMLGCPVRNAKTLILTEQEDTARKIVFVLSYFMRCSQIFEQDLKFRDNNAETLSYSIKKKDITSNSGPINQTLQRIDENQSSQIIILAKSSSSPVLEKSLNFPKMKNAE